MKKKMVFVSLLMVLLICVGFIFLIGNRVGAYLWNVCIFIFAPIACVLLVVELILIVVRGIMRKKILWNLVFLCITMVYAYPITILFGISGITYPTKENEQGVVMQIPVKDAVLFGGKEFKTHAKWPSECYAYDIVKEPYETGSSELSDYGIFLEDVYAPVSGEVIGMKESEEDCLPGSDSFQSGPGNYIYIKIQGSGTYLILAHLEKDSIEVKVGDLIQKGQFLGKVGNSGTSTEPHLHIQHQKENPNKMLVPICAQGLPILFE